MTSIYQFGTFDVANYGDLLFPLLAQRRLKALGFKVAPVSPIGGAPVWQDCMSSAGIDEIEYIGPPSGVLIGGGYIVRTKPIDLPVYNRGSIPLLGNPDLWIGASHLAMDEVPVCWNTPGVAHPFPEEEWALIRECLDRSNYISVRDEPSRNFLLEVYPDAKIEVVPDPVWEISDYWTPQELSNAYDQLFRQYQTEKPLRSIAVHVNTGFLGRGQEKRVAYWLDQISRKLDARVMLLAIGPCHGDDKLSRFVGEQMTTDPLIIDKPKSLKEIAACIAKAELYLGSSMHGLITASAFCVPGICVTSSNIPKFEGLQKHFNCEDAWSESWELIPEQVSSLNMNRRREQLREVRQKMREGLDGHWHTILKIFQKYSDNNRELMPTNDGACGRVRQNFFQYRADFAAMKVMKYIRLYNRIKAIHPDTERLFRENSILREDLYNLYLSSSWRLTFPFRKTGEVIHMQSRRFRGLLQKFTLKFLRPLYYYLPETIRNTYLVQKLKDHYNRYIWK